MTGHDRESERGRLAALPNGVVCDEVCRRTRVPRGGVLMARARYAGAFTAWPPGLETCDPAAVGGPRADDQSDRSGRR